MSEHTNSYARLLRVVSSLVLIGLFALWEGPASAQAQACDRTVTARVVALEQVYFYNRFGAFNPVGMLYALERDVVPVDPALGLAPGNVQLRSDKRPRPLVLRVNEGDCLQVTFTNLLSPARPDPNAPATRAASMHVNGLDYVGSIASDGANVGQNASSLAAPGESRLYTWYAKKEGTYLLFSMGAPAGGEGDGGQLVLGLFGAVNVEPRGARWYRSQVTAAQLEAATIGTNPNGTPILNYEAVGADGTPILNMLSAANEIVHSDLNAIVTGFTENCTNAPPSGTCGEPFREFTVIFHDELKTVQAFPELDLFVFHAARDGFGVNYGSSAIGAPVLANRFGIGPARGCAECKFEEFFLSSWPNGDPAMVVRRDPVTGAAVEALYPDDPSNVHHSYLNDPVRFRNIHAGPRETHVFHLHGHQWLQSPRDENSTYLDSQTISPGAAFTYEIAYGGSGNRNLTPGDAIFHCHLYPHFAQGMWELWRVHDVFENGRPDRNLPDGEIAGGTPTPAVVPIPGLAMAPMPTPEFRGYPFYIAGQAGHRPPQPPLDLEADGGLPRHRVRAGTVVDGPAAIEPHLLEDPVAARVLATGFTAEANDPNRPFMLALARKLTSADIELLPQDGTPDEKKAIEFHQGAGGTPVVTPYGWPARGYPSYTASGDPGLFLVNGLPAAPGGVFGDPCPTSAPIRTYRGSVIQLSMTVNRAGWHDRQARILTLDEDVLPTLNGTRPTEPLFFRANSGECVVFKHTNLVPGVLNLDDFQIFTPTDTIGQHIHLVKFDLASADGSGNGWNYEDGTFSPDEVRERIHANNTFQQAAGGTQILEARPHPVHGSGPNNAWVGAQTTVQRWWADPLVNTRGEDRTIRSVFTHDHFGPSSHQQHGLYAALVVEPAGSRWQALDGSPLGGRTDGGPTSYAANIITADQAKSYREFDLQIADFAIVYTPELQPVNGPNRKEEPLPKAVGFGPVPTPESVSAADPGTQLVNYRNEPIPLRIGEKNAQGQFVQKPVDAGNNAGDLANVFSSRVHGDPATPVLLAYEGDRVQVRLLQGAHEEQHVWNLHGLKWLFEPASPNSGYTNSQHLGISEHFEFVIAAMPDVVGGKIDYLYSSAAADNLWDGQWGILRTFQGVQPGLAPLPNNPSGKVANKGRADTCPPPAAAPVRRFFVNAVLARDVLPVGALVYNEKFGGIADPNAILFVEDADLPALLAGTKKPEPLILRAAAGDCIQVTLRNRLPRVLPEADSWNLMPPIVDGFNFNQVKASNRVSLHPQLLAYNVSDADGAAVGLNADTTVAPGKEISYVWYAGDRRLDANGNTVAAPIEFGATSLRDMGDVIKHASHGAIGALIIEPQGSSWTTVGNSKATADVKDASGNLLFREFVVLYQDDLSLQQGGRPMRNMVDADDPEDSGMKGFNYRTEPLWARLGLPPETPLETLNDQDFTNVLSSTASNPGCGGPCGDPATPVFTAALGTPVRFRVVQAAGHPRQHAFALFGHHWSYEPWTQGSTVLGENPLTFEVGATNGISPTRHVNILATAGGLFRVPGDYLYRSQESLQFGGGLWGIFRVTPQVVATTP